MEVRWTNEYRAFRYQVYARFQRWVEGHETLARFGAAFVLAVLTGGLAQIAIYTPLTPVPYTGQVLGIALMGGLLGRRWGTTSALLYVGMGVIGLPVYAGQLATFGSFQFLGGLGVFANGLSAGYLLGFVLQAYLVGAVVDARQRSTNRRLVGFAAAAVGGLIVFALLDVLFLADYARLYATSPIAFPNAWFLVLSAGLLLLVAGGAWLALTGKARRERIELFMGNVAGLLALYAVGALWFAAMWRILGNGPLGFLDLLRFTVLPFIPADLTKILLAIGLLTLVRPTRAELEGRRRAPTEAPA